MVGIQKPLPVSRIINCIVPMRGKKKKKEKSELCGLEPQRDTVAPKSELCLGLPLSPASWAPGYLLLQEVQNQTLKVLRSKIASLEPNRY